MLNVATLLNQIGLALNMVGVALVFKWGLPQPNPDSQGTRRLEGGTPASDGRPMRRVRMEAAATQVTYRRVATCGLLFMFLGFLLQFGATFVSEPDNPHRTSEAMKSGRTYTK